MKKTLFAAALIWFAGWAAAQDAFPNRALTIVVPTGPSGQTDVFARLIAEQLRQRLNQPVVVENKPGAAGNLGAGEVARAPADGHTLLMATSTIAMTPGLGAKVSYELDKDLTAVAMVGATAMVIAVHPAVEAKSLQQLIALAKRQPGKLAYSTCGNASPMHLAGELLKLTASIDLLHVPYKGCAPALADVLGGQVPIAFNTISNTAAHEKTGRVRILAVASAKRLADFPDLPTAGEQGMSGYQADIWFGLFAPSQTPRAAVVAVNAAVNRAIGDAEIRDKMRSQYYEPQPGSADDMAAFVKSEVVKWGKTIREANIKAD